MGHKEENPKKGHWGFEIYNDNLGFGLERLLNKGQQYILAGDQGLSSHLSLNYQRDLNSSTIISGRVKADIFSTSNDRSGNTYYRPYNGIITLDAGALKEGKNLDVIVQGSAGLREHKFTQEYQNFWHKITGAGYYFDNIGDNYLKTSFVGDLSAGAIAHNKTGKLYTEAFAGGTVGSNIAGVAGVTIGVGGFEPGKSIRFTNESEPLSYAKYAESDDKFKLYAGLTVGVNYNANSSTLRKKFTDVRTDHKGSPEQYDFNLYMLELDGMGGKESIRSVSAYDKPEADIKYGGGFVDRYIGKDLLYSVTTEKRGIKDLTPYVNLKVASNKPNIEFNLSVSMNPDQGYDKTVDIKRNTDALNDLGKSLVKEGVSIPSSNTWHFNGDGSNKTYQNKFYVNAGIKMTF